MRKDYTANPLPVTKDLEGMSLKSVQEHQKLYEGYVKKMNEVQAKLETADRSAANGVYSEYGEMKRQETFAVNGMKLHEIYFRLLGGDGEVGGALRTLIERDFGSVEAWKEDFTATGISARGWAVLAYDTSDNRLHNYAMDAQNVGAVWGAVPLVPMDVYEHAYFMDHGVNRKAYIEAFIRQIDWSVVRELAERQGVVA